VLVPKDRFEDYVVDHVVGHGGSSTVYRAHDATRPDHVVALKVLDEHHHQPAQLAKLRHEFTFAKRVDHPHVVTMYECGPDWLAMEYIGGGTVSRLVNLRNQLTALAEVASALDHAHQLGIVHCDVKPTNILVCEVFSRRGAVLIDFGVAHSIADDAHHRPTHIEASLPYAAPELLHGRAPSAASDEYALACTAVEMLTGSPPFNAITAIALIDDHLNSPVPRYSRQINWIPRAFDSMLAKAMAKDPDMRYPTCTEFVALITKALRVN
jgi:serine/threonine-protein kinase